MPITIDTGIEEGLTQVLVDTAQNLGIDTLLRKWAGTSDPADSPPTPDWWTANKNWAMPAGIIAGGSLVTLLVVGAVRSRG